MSGPVSTKASKDKSAGQTERHFKKQVRRPQPSSPHSDVLAMQHAAGNRAVSHLLQSGKDSSLPLGDHEGSIETAPNNSLKPLPSVSISPAVEKRLPSPVRSVLKNGSGQPLDPSTRFFMESRFGYDFSPVRVHTGSQAIRSARAINALAYTVGRDIVFNEGGYAPGKTTGFELLAHELAHTIQQGSGTRIPPLSPDCTFEVAADSASRSIASGSSVVGIQPASGVGLARAVRSAHMLSDDELVNEINAVNERLLEPESYPGREADERWFNELMDVLSTRRSIEPGKLVSEPSEAQRVRKIDLRGSTESVTEEEEGRPPEEQRAVAADRPLSLERSVDPRALSSRDIRDEIRLIRGWLESHPVMTVEERAHLGLQLETFHDELNDRRRRAQESHKRFIGKRSDVGIERLIREYEARRAAGREIRRDKQALELLKQEEVRRRQERRSAPVTVPKTVAEAISMLEEAWREAEQYPDVSWERGFQLVSAVETYLRPLTRPEHMRRRLGRLPWYDRATFFPEAAYSEIWSLRLKMALQRRNRNPSLGGQWQKSLTVVKSAREHLEVLASERSLESSSIPATHKAATRGFLYTLAGMGAILAAPFVVKGLVAAGPLVIGEAKLIGWAAGQAGRRVLIWAVSNPYAATELAEYSAGVVLSISAVGLGEFLEGLSTPEGAALTALDLLILRVSIGGGKRPRGTVDVEAEVVEISSDSIKVKVRGQPRSGGRTSTEERPATEGAAPSEAAISPGRATEPGGKKSTAELKARDQPRPAVETTPTVEQPAAPAIETSAKRRPTPVEAELAVSEAATSRQSSEERARTGLPPSPPPTGGERGGDSRPPRPEPTFRQRQRASVLQRQADNLDAEAKAKEAKAIRIERFRPDRAARIRSRAADERAKAERLRAEAEEFASGRRSAIEDIVGGPEEIESAFEKATAEIPITGPPNRAAQLRAKADRLEKEAAFMRERATFLRRLAKRLKDTDPEGAAFHEARADLARNTAQKRLAEVNKLRQRAKQAEKKAIRAEHDPTITPRLVRNLERGPHGGRVVYRVEGGTVPGKRSKELVHIDENNNVTLKRGGGEETGVFVNFGSRARAEEFLEKRSAGARIVAFEVEESFVQAVRSAATPESKGTRGVPAPRLVDVRFAEDQIFIPEDLVPEFQKFIIPGSGRVVKEKE